MSETQHPTLAEFLLARIEEDEGAARAGAGEPAYPHYGESAAEESWRMAKGEGCAENGYRHLRRWMPARVLAECKAKRVAVKWYVEDDEVVMGATVKAMAAVYAGHPDYDPAWTPEQDYTRPHDSPGGQDEHPSTKPKHQAQPGDRPNPNPDPDGSPTDQRHRPR